MFFLTTWHQRNIFEIQKLSFCHVILLIDNINHVNRLFEVMYIVYTTSLSACVININIHMNLTILAFWSGEFTVKNIRSLCSVCPVASCAFNDDKPTLIHGTTSIVPLKEEVSLYTGMATTKDAIYVYVSKVQKM